MSGAMKRIIALVVALVLIMAPLSSCFAAGEVVTEEILYLIWETLKSWGIEIVENGVSEFTQNVQHWLDGTLDDYLNDEINEVLDTWITGVQWTIDNFGRRILNGKGVTQLYAFALWLKTHFNLTDNQTNALGAPSSTVTINTVIGYADALTINYRSSSYGTWNFEVVKNNSDYPVFLFVYKSSNNNTTYVGAYSETPFSILETLYRTSGQTTTYTSYTSELYNGYYFTWDMAGQSTNYFNTYTNASQQPFGPNPIKNDMTKDTCRSLLAGNPIPEEEPDVNINTGTITFPPQVPSYQTGYSMIYYDDGSVAYLDINWPETISVDNLPAAISPSGTQDPGFKGAFTPIKAFVNTFSDGMALIKDITFRLPVQAWACFYAIFGITVVFGALHMFKEH